MEQVQDLLHHRGQSAGVEEILHQVFAGRLDVGDVGRAARDAVEFVEAQFDAQPPGDGDQVDDGVGGSADRHVHRDGVLERRARHDARRAQVLAHHFDDAAAAHLGHRQPARIRRGNAGAAGQGHAQRFGQAGHGGSGAHHGAVAGAARDAAFDFAPFLFGEAAGAEQVEELAAVGAGAEPLVAPLAGAASARRAP